MSIDRNSFGVLLPGHPQVNCRLESQTTKKQQMNMKRLTMLISACRNLERSSKTKQKPCEQASTARWVPLLACALLVPSLHAEPVRILPLGDSITQGGKRDREEYTYRWPLAKILNDQKVDYDFIGSTNKGLDDGATWPDIDGKPFDGDHEGHYGWKTAAVRDKLAEWMKSYSSPPDIVLIHLGTNDQKSKDPEADIIRPLTDIISMIREKNPHAVFLVGHLNFNWGVDEIRALVNKMAADLNTETSPVIAVRHYEGWQSNPDLPNPDTFDWAHPNRSGQQKMADNWWKAMKPFVGK